MTTTTPATPALTLLPDVATAKRASCDLYAMSGRMTDAIAAEERADAQARENAPTFAEAHARWMRNAQARMAAQNRETRAVIAESESYSAQFDGEGCEVHYDEIIDEARCHEDALESERAGVR